MNINKLFNFTYYRFGPLGVVGVVGFFGLSKQILRNYKYRRVVRDKLNLKKRMINENISN
jgi:hypothetical protein